MTSAIAGSARSCPAAALRRRLLVLAVAGLLGAPSHAQEVDAQVEKHGDRIVINVKVHVPASIADTWAVMTDYDNMAGFMANMKSSRITRRQGQQIEVAQAGEKKFAFFTFAVSSVRLIDLTPMHEIRSRLVSGDFKAYEALTRLAEDGENNTIVTHHSEYVPANWVPPVVGPNVIAGETRKHYASLIAEVLRRRNAGAAAPAKRASEP